MNYINYYCYCCYAYYYQVGAGVAETMKTIGKETCLKRINKVLESLDD